MEEEASRRRKKNLEVEKGRENKLRGEKPDRRVEVTHVHK